MRACMSSVISFLQEFSELRVGPHEMDTHSRRSRPGDDSRLAEGVARVVMQGHNRSLHGRKLTHHQREGDGCVGYLICGVRGGLEARLLASRKLPGGDVERRLPNP